MLLQSKTGPAGSERLDENQRSGSQSGQSPTGTPGPRLVQSAGKRRKMTHGLQFHGGLFSQRLARKLIDEGYDPKAVLANIPPERQFLEAEKLMVPLHEHATFLEQAVELTGNPQLGIEFATTQDFLDLGLVGYLFKTSATLSEAFTVLATYCGLFSQALRFDVSKIETTGRVEWQYDGGVGLRLGHCAEFSAMLLLQGVRRFAARQVCPRNIHFAHNRRQGIADVTAALGVRPVYGRSVNALEFELSDLSTPFASADERLHGILKDQAEMLQAQDIGEKNQLIVVVEGAILQRLPDGDATLPKVAQELGMSSRTLSRHLSQEGTSFFAILEGLRRSLAFRYLKEPDMTLADVSYFLGYSSLSSFNDAFKRWTGQSPGQYRAGNRTPG